MVAPSTIVARGLSRNALVYLTREGLRGVRLRSEASLALALILPLPLVSAAYDYIQLGALDIYIIAWIVISGLLYDALKWRGIRSIETSSPDSLKTRESWLVTWPSIRMADWNGRTLWFSSTNPPRKVSVTFDRSDAGMVEQSLTSWGVRYSWKPPRLPRTFSGFWPLVFLVFAVGQVILILAATLPFFPGEEQTYAAILSSTHNQISRATFGVQFQDIFLNNIQVALGGMIPFFGQLTFGIANYNTGRVIQVLAIGDQVQPSVILLSLYLFPHTWVEESAYPIATMAGLFAITQWRSVSPGEFSRWLNRGSAKLAFAMGGVALILLTAGIIETVGLYLGFGEILFWVPLVLAYYLFTVMTKKQRREHVQ